MSSKHRKEKSYNMHGMRSILNVFTSRHRFVIQPYHFLCDERGAHRLDVSNSSNIYKTKKNTQ